MTRKRPTASTIVLGLVFLAGLLLLLYPAISNMWNTRRSESLIGDYAKQAKETSQEDNAAWLSMADGYNASLAGKGIPDAFAIHSANDNLAYTEQMAFRDDGMMGFIRIPKIGVNLPIYHGTGEDVLKRGAGHLQGSALPVGGKGTHCVISAHRGLPSAAMFTDLDQLKKGDRFYLHVLNRVCAYKVDKIEEVDPGETRSLAVEADKDLATLVTCTPYGVNTRRLLVRGHRVKYSKKAEVKDAEHARASIFTQYWLWILGGLAIVVIVGTLAWRAAGRKRSAGEAAVPRHARGKGGRHGRSLR